MLLAAGLGVLRLVHRDLAITRIVVHAVNLAIVWYLVARLRRETGAHA